MHETALVKDLVREINRLARHYGSSRVARAHVRLGLLAPVSEEALREQFRHAAAHTLAEGAKLVIEKDTDLKSTVSLGVLLKRIELSPERPAYPRLTGTSAGESDIEGAKDVSLSNTRGL